MTLQEWVTASQVRNYFLNDPILDWLHLYGETNGFKKDDKKTEFDFSLFIQRKGIEFEKRVYDALGLKPLLPFQKNVISNEADLEAWHEKTINLLPKESILAQALIMNKDEKLWGIPDFIVSLQWLLTHYHDDLREYLPDTLDMESLQHTYVIGDIKYTTFKTNASNSSDYKKARKKWIKEHKYYVAQLWLYYRILSSIPGLKTIPLAFLMLREPVPVSMDNIEGHVLVINFEEQFMGSIIDQARDAVEWLHFINQDGANFKVGEHPSLYPNMSNKDDFPWHDAKKQIAKMLDELTQLWFLSPKVRILLHERNIKTCKELGEAYRNNPGILHVLFKTKGQRYYAFQAIIEANYGEKPIYMKPNPRVEDQWYPKKPGIKEFYVDYETFSGINDPFESFPNPSYSNLIFMIGIGEEVNNTWEFTCLIARDTSDDAEKEVIQQFYEFLHKRTRETGNRDFLVYHWAKHEKSELMKAATKHQLPYTEYVARFIDLEKIFETQPIGVKGALTYSIKSVAPALKELGFIETSWPQGGLADGLSAMIGAWHAYEQAFQAKTPVTENPIMKEIKDYNEIDCKVMYEILKWMRKHRDALSHEEHHDP